MVVRDRCPSVLAAYRGGHGYIGRVVRVGCDLLQPRAENVGGPALRLAEEVRIRRQRYRGVRVPEDAGCGAYRCCPRGYSNVLADRAPIGAADLTADVRSDLASLSP